MKPKNIFTVIMIVLLIIGNIWCYAENGRLLHPMTNMITLGLTYLTFRK